jgi:hypothetical protein
LDLFFESARDSGTLDTVGRSPKGRRRREERSHPHEGGKSPKAEEEQRNTLMRQQSVSIYPGSSRRHRRPTWDKTAYEQISPVGHVVLGAKLLGHVVRLLEPYGAKYSGVREVAA